MKVIINGNPIDQEKALIPYFSEGIAYGYGAFETIKCKAGKVYYLKEHYDRLVEACNTLHLTLDYSYKEIESYVHEVMARNNMATGAIKIQYVKNNIKNDLIISMRENKYSRQDYERGFKVTFTEVKRNPYSPLTYIKSNNYMENIIVRKGALEKGYEEAVFENTEGAICEGTISNLFFIKGNCLYTPHVNCGLLAGIMRNQVIEGARKLGITVVEGHFDRETLLEAEEVFLTNSLLEVMPVAQLEDKVLNLEENKITKTLMKHYGLMED